MRISEYAARFFVELIFISMLSACALRSSRTTVSIVAPEPAYLNKCTRHVVGSKETLYSIAKHYQTTPLRLMTLNEMSSPYRLFVGQGLTVCQVPPSKLEVTSIKIAQPSLQRRLKKNISLLASRKILMPTVWSKPLNGRFVTHQAHSRKGIYFESLPGQKVYAAAAGKVVYTGNGLNQYGDLIILRHPGGFLSAYACNKHSFVQERQWVAQHQMIAEVGLIKNNQYGLYFEMRHLGQPVDLKRYF